MLILKSASVLLAAILLLVKINRVLGRLECDDLTIEECAFAVASSGTRCVLEKSILANGETTTSCQTSFIMAERLEEWIESNECINSCGLERETYGLSSDSLMEAGFADKLCSTECQNSCPNIVDLYMNLVAGEGEFLPRLCHDHRAGTRRIIAEGGQIGGGLLSSSFVSAPAPSPSPGP